MFQLKSERMRGLKLLCLGAHSDDIEIGSGGTILLLLDRYKDCHVTWVVLSADGERENEAFLSATRFLNAAKGKTVIIKRFKESFFPYRGRILNACLSNLRKR